MFITTPLVQGEPLLELPKDLYIPPDALEVFLLNFSGPLDLLLYLIRRQNLDILNIPIAEITQQYMSYIGMMQQLRLELAAEYLVMAAMLAEIKSRMLLPRPAALTNEESDPRVELIRRLQEYEAIKDAAMQLDQLPQVGRDVFLANIAVPALEKVKLWPKVELNELLSALQQVLQRVAWTADHHIAQETLSVRERMTQVLSRLTTSRFCSFSHLFTLTEGRMGVVVTFIAILELLKQSLLEIVQSETAGSLHVRAVTPCTT